MFCSLRGLQHTRIACNLHDTSCTMSTVMRHHKQSLERQDPPEAQRCCYSKQKDRAGYRQHRICKVPTLLVLHKFTGKHLRARDGNFFLLCFSACSFPSPLKNTPPNRPTAQHPHTNNFIPPDDSAGQSTVLPEVYVRFLHRSFCSSGTPLHLHSPPLFIPHRGRNRGAWVYLPTYMGAVLHNRPHVYLVSLQRGTGTGT